jgi:glycosyltransferase involved in cell wall biosynthesis
MLKGNLDRVNRREVVGWVQDDAHPDRPVSLLIMDNDALIGRVLANGYRADLEQAGIGSGRHAFEFDVPGGLAPLERHVIRVCRESDGADIAQSPVVVQPSQSFDAAAQEALGDLLARHDADDDIVKKIDFLADQTARLVQQLADRDSGRLQRKRYRHLLQRWARRLPQEPEQSATGATPAPAPRALIIDDRVPKADRDAGSSAILSHMRSLRRLGYELTFVPALEFEPVETDVSALDEIGARCCRSPYYGSVEEILRRQAGEFDVIYLHRVSNASKYGALVRQHFPRARFIYSVADLHHLRLARQAAVEDRPELIALTKRVRLAEFVAAATADAVITHSSHEAEVLRKEIVGVNVHTVLWSVAVRPTPVPFSRRHGVAFIGGFDHDPNRDAARWLISEIMPLVRRRDPLIECLLVGSEMPEQLLRLCGEGVVAVGHVKDLAEVFDRVRLTVAPLDYGAGIKGKVIDSLGAGIPCVCTPIGAEGLDLPLDLRACVAQGAQAFADAMLQFHSDKAANDRCRRAGLAYIKAVFSEQQLDASMRQVLGKVASLPPLSPPPEAARVKVTRKARPSSQLSGAVK